MKPINTVEVLLAGEPVGELVASRQGIWIIRIYSGQPSAITNHHRSRLETTDAP